MANLNAAGIQMAYGAIGQAWEDSSPLLVITEAWARARRATPTTTCRGAQVVTKWVAKSDRAELIPDYVRGRSRTSGPAGRPGLLIIPRPGEYDADEHPYSPVKGWSPARPDDVKSAVKALLPRRIRCSMCEGVYYADATSELLKFAELAQVPC